MNRICCTTIGIVVAIVALVVPVSLCAEESGQQSPPQAGYDAQGLLKIDPAFFDLAAATGGDFYFWAPDEFASSNLTIPTHNEDILLAYGALDRSIRTFTFEVDTTVTEIATVVGAQEKLILTLIQPDGVVKNDAQPGVALQHFQHMLIATITSPQPGQWSIEAQGAGKFSLSVRAHVADRESVDALMLIDFGFIEARGRPGHEGYFESTAPLIAGSRRLCRATMSGSWQDVRIELVSLSATPLATAEIVATSESLDDEIVGLCPIPHQPFRVVLAGVDRQGKPFQRTVARLFESQ